MTPLHDTATRLRNPRSQGSLKQGLVRPVVWILVLGVPLLPGGLIGLPGQFGPTEARGIEPDGQTLAAPVYSTPRHLANLNIDRLGESSGLAASQREADVFWTHNDSGDKPRLFAFSRDGEHLGTCRVQSASAVDWEDMASFQRDGDAYLLIGDIGDNSSRRETANLHLIKEPELHAREAELLWTASLHYDDGPQNAEALAVDAVSRTILVANKRWTANTNVYALPLPDKAPTQPLEAKRIATVKIPAVTAMDVTPDGLRIVLATYGNAFEFTRKAGEDWRVALQRPPREIGMPPRKQGETICYGRDGKSLYLTSEKLPTPLFELRAE